MKADSGKGIPVSNQITAYHTILRYYYKNMPQVGIHTRHAIIFLGAFVDIDFWD